MLKMVIIWSAIALFTAWAINLPGIVADTLYKNVEDIVDGEMPRTVTAFQSGPEVVSTIGGSGEGLNCSLPALVNSFFDGSKDENDKHHLVLQRFRQACVFHDLCYRHGLATYGYNQNDCDRILQNEAFRLCLYIRNGTAESSAARCQTDSKLVLGGVSLGGYGAYRAWNRSTYFEFESDPSRSNGFFVSRVVDHPFKFLDAVDPADKYRNESDQVILTFENIRSNLTVTCVTCANVPVFKWTSDPNDVSRELKSVNITRLPEALLRHQDQMLSNTSPVWLPPRRRHAAPHLLIDNDGKNHLIWMSRNNPGDTVSCIVLSDAAHLLTHTLPKYDLCHTHVGSTLDMVEVDMFATSPLPMEIPGALAQDRIFATGISAQKTKYNDLSFCSRSAFRKVKDREVDKEDDKAKCHTFSEERVSKGDGLGAFQNFAVVRPGQQIFFARDVALPTDSPLSNAWKRVRGDTYSPGGVLLAIDISPPASADGPAVPKIQKIVPFRIDDRFDPMMPLTRRNGDLRFLSLEVPSFYFGLGASKATLRVATIDFQKENPAIDYVKLKMNDRDIQLHGSWAMRPVLVLETKEPQPKTKLVFSRGEIEPGKAAGPKWRTEALSLQTLVFEREANSPDGPFLKTGGAKCTVRYTFKTRSDYACYRTFDPSRPMRSSPAAKMQASQLLVGHFAGSGGHGLAFPDACLKGEPVVLRPKAGPPGEFEPVSEKSAYSKDLKREITCEPLNSNEYVSKPIKQEEMLAGWPLP